MATREEFKEVVRELVKEEVARLMGENQPSVFRKVLAAAPEIAEDEENLANRADRGGTEPHDLTPTERSLPKKNTVIPSDPATPSPAVASYTNEYLGDLTRRR